MNTRTWWGIIAVLFIIIVVLSWVLFASPAPATAPTVILPTTEESTTGGSTTSRPLHTRVSVTSPKSGASVQKTFTVSGMAPGNWFFEASFPIRLVDQNDKLISLTHAEALGDWMTSEFVPFTATITFPPQTNVKGTLILNNDNPSGLPENDKEVRIIVRFK